MQLSSRRFAREIGGGQDAAVLQHEQCVGFRSGGSVPGRAHAQNEDCRREAVRLHGGRGGDGYTRQLRG